MMYEQQQQQKKGGFISRLLANPNNANTPSKDYYQQQQISSRTKYESVLGIQYDNNTRTKNSRSTDSILKVSPFTKYYPTEQ